MKKLLLLIVMMLSVAASAFAVEEVEIDGLWYELVSKTKEAKVIQYKNDIKYSGDIVIPETVKYEGADYSVTSIGLYALLACENLTSVMIGGCVASIELGAFSNCIGLTSITIPNSVTSIGEEAFYACTGLTSITIPNSVTSIGRASFANCSGLTTVTIGKNVTNIGDDAFSRCSSLTSVDFGKSVIIVGDHVFRECKSLNSITIPNSVTTIGKWAFYDCSNLTSVTIGNSVTKIEEGTFEYCTGLTSVTIGNSVTSIGYNAFYGCSGLSVVTIPNNVTRIIDNAFCDCSSLKSITLGSGISVIGFQSFASCPELTDVYCYAENLPSTNTDAFEGSYIEYVTLHVPDASIDLYKAAEPWKNFKEIVGLDGSIPEQCATPTIQIVDGKLKFTCETEGVTFKTTYKVVDSGNNAEGDEVVVGGTATCQVSVYAAKEGYLDSDAATTNITIAWGKKGDVNADGEVNVGDIVTTTNIMAGKDE